MENKSESLNECLLKISNVLNDLLLYPQENLSLITSIEDWMKTYFHRIQLMSKENSVVIRDLDDHEARADAIFIFNSRFKVISYSGTQNFFPGQATGENEPPNLLEMVEEHNRARFKSAITDAIENRRSVKLDLRIKTNINILNNCTFELDIDSSNLPGDRFTGKLVFSEIEAAQLSEYQLLILDSLPGMDLYLFDKNYNYLFSAGKEKERFELTNIQLTGRSIFEMLEKKVVKMIFPCVAKTLDGIENEDEFRFSQQVYYIKGLPVKNVKNETVGAIVLTQNITHDKFLEEQLKESREEAFHSDKLKSIFIANLSHEMRTPLNAIIGFTEQLEKRETEADQLKFIRLIKKASDHLLYLVTEIVYLFKLGMGKVYIEKSPFSLSELLHELQETFEKQALDKNLQFKLYHDKDLPDGLVGDSFRLRQVLMNLLVNAVKYTDKGSVSLNCKVQSETSEKVILTFEVQDTGIGISRHSMKTIFNVFEQGEKLKAGYRGGAGLGLGICKNLVELLGGQISVSSKVKVGSTFRVSLPFEKSDLELPREQVKINFDLETNNKLLTGKKILVADDDDNNRILAEVILKNWGTDFTLVEDGQQAIDELKSEKFDIALIDIHMPKKNGLEVVKNIRSNNKGINYRTPIIFITANVFKSDLVEYNKAGFDDYMIKPFREAELYNKLCTILAIQHGINHTPVPQSVPAALTTQKDVFNTDALVKTAKGDHVVFTKMVTSFIQGVENLNALFAEGLSNNEWDEIGRQAHKLLPSFRYFSLTNTARMLEIIENATLWDVNYDLATKIVEQATGHITEIIDQAHKTLENSSG